MSTTAENNMLCDQLLNQKIQEGKVMEAFEEFYADDVSMQENDDPPIAGKDANRKREEEFGDQIEQFHGAECRSHGAGGNQTFAEWSYDMTLKGIGRVKMNEVAVRTWRDGKIVNEHFYYNRG